MQQNTTQVLPPTPAPSVAAMPPPPMGQGPIPPMAQQGGSTSPFAPVPGTPGASLPVPPVDPPGAELGEGTRFGNQRTAGAKAGPADYAGVQGFADQAYQQARRNIDPMQEQQQRRMQQDLINKGVDPSSPQGMAMLDQQNRNFADQDNSALFGALQFGQGIQNQMFGQSLANTQQAGDMQKAKWQAQLAQSGQDLQRYGMDQNYGLGMSGLDMKRALGNQQFQLGMGHLDMARQGQDFNQMMGLEGLQFRDRAYGDQRSDYQDALTMSLMGITPIPGVIGYDPSNLAATQIGASGGGGLLSGF